MYRRFIKPDHGDIFLDGHRLEQILQIIHCSGKLNQLCFQNSLYLTHSVLSRTYRSASVLKQAKRERRQRNSQRKYEKVGYSSKILAYVPERIIVKLAQDCSYS